MVEVTEIHADGSETQLEQCMELETEATMGDAGGASSSCGEAAAAEHKIHEFGEQPKRLVKLLECKPIIHPPPKLWLWVDGCLAPALPNSPLVIDLPHSTDADADADADMDLPPSICADGKYVARPPPGCAQSGTRPDETWCQLQREAAARRSLPQRSGRVLPQP